MLRRIAVTVLAWTAAACSTPQPLRTAPRWLPPPPRTSAPVMHLDGRPMLETRAGLCPLDVPGVTADMRTTHDRVLLLVRAPPGVAHDELGERARIMSYATHYLLPAAYDERLGRLPIPVELTVQNVNGAILLTVKPREPWKLQELSEMLAHERRWLGRDLCR